jgi:integrase/recombinase XerD
VIYATGLRRLEIVTLKLFDLQLDRGLIVVRQGKGKKDRYVPVAAYTSCKARIATCV